MLFTVNNNKYDQSVLVTDIYILTKFGLVYVIELREFNLKKKEEEKMNITPYHSPIHII